MDTTTFEYYQHNVHEIFKRYEQNEAYDNSLLPHVFSKGQKVLDIGCGSGRDMSLLSEIGCEVYGIEPVEEFRTLAYNSHPELEGRIFTGSIPEDVPELPIKGFDGILVSAVLMHIPEGRLFDAAFKIRDLMKMGGVLLVSVPVERDDLEEPSTVLRSDENTAAGNLGGETRDTNGRLMNIRPEARIRILFERLGFDTESRYYSADRLMRTGISWVSIVFRYRGGGVSESVDKIETIIVQDRKWATYKLALLRALCDTAQKEPNTAFWDVNGQVHVPIESVSRRWIEYYWPIVESRHFIPQMRGEKPDGSRFIAFRKNLQQLTDEYQELGGIEEFVFQRDEGRLRDRSSILLKQTNEKVIEAIRQPIFYTGGGTSADKPFSYNSSYETVVLSSELWRELILLGHIIADTLILRWAELTADISKGDIPISQMVELLLRDVEPSRNVADARQVYRRASSLECVWTGKTLTQSFDVDHAIPYSLRHDNSLWNLFPADPKKNNAKRDKLPESDLILHRQDAIPSYWELLKTEIPGRFTSDYKRITGEERLPESTWHTHLFSVFIEVIETTATTRGTPRWNGA